MDGLNRSHDILRWDRILDIVNGSPDKTPTGHHNLHPFFNVVVDFFRGAEWQYPLRINAAAQKVIRSPNDVFSHSGSIPAAEVWTGLRISMPARIMGSIRLGMLPQQCLATFHDVWV